MPYTIEYLEEENYISIEFTGFLTLTLMRSYLAELLPILEKTGCTRLLNDPSQTQVQLSSVDIIQASKMANESPLTAHLKRAVIASPGMSCYNMYEILSKTTGQYIQIFPERERALKWLLSDNG